jgi:hypothetical protein
LNIHEKIEESMGLSYITFSDTDGNGWLFQETITRLPVTTGARTATYESVKDPASALRRAAAARVQFEMQIGQAGQELAKTGRFGVVTRGGLEPSGFNYGLQLDLIKNLPNSSEPH